MRRIALRVSCLVSLVLLASPGVLRADAVWKAGSATIKITPPGPMWMAGYASRTKPAEGTLIDLWAKALVLEDEAGQRVALVTMDLIGIDRDLSLAVRGAIEKRHGLAIDRVALCTSHTHCGPVVGRNLLSMYFLDELQRKRVEDYAAQLEQNLVNLVGQAIERLAPSVIAWGSGQETFAVNRRNNPEADVPLARAQGRLRGPVDYDVPVLSIRDAEGKLSAVVFGYACHATVMDFFQWSGDYPGFAQLALEEAHPGAVALFWAGCGADQNPLPRRRVELAEEYGKRLARSVDRVLDGVMIPLGGKIATRYSEIDLPLGRLPERQELEQQVSSDNRYEAHRARMLLAQLDAGRPLKGSYPYPIQTWQLGPDLLFIALGGEVVVDYALRIKHELGAARTWVAGYSNDVMAYIPSRRVLGEGGYEGGGAMVYYGLPTIWAPEVEDAIVNEVHAQASGSRGDSDKP